MSAVHSDPQIERIVSFVAAETGLCFRSGSADIEAGIRRAMVRSKVTNLQRFVTLLESRQLPIDELVNEFTVGESYFFRERITSTSSGRKSFRMYSRDAGRAIHCVSGVPDARVAKRRSRFRSR